MCPSCGQRMPHPDDAAWAGWSEPWSHRRESDNEPCPAWKKLPSIAPPPPLVVSAPKLSPVQEWYAWIARHVKAAVGTSKPKRAPKPAPTPSRWKQLPLFDDAVEQTRYPVDVWRAPEKKRRAI